VWTAVASLILLLIVVLILDGVLVPPEDNAMPSAAQTRRHRLLILLGHITDGFFAGSMGMLGHVSESSKVHGERRWGPSTRRRTLYLLAFMFGLFLTLTYEAVRPRRYTLDLIYFLSFRRAYFI
jgi:hypothetical protein